jgi:hypothetical protein
MQVSNARFGLLRTMTALTRTSNTPTSTTWSPITPRNPRGKAPHKVDALFDQIVRSAPVVDILTKLLGPGLRLHGSNST